MSECPTTIELRLWIKKAGPDPADPEAAAGWYISARSLNGKSETLGVAPCDARQAARIAKAAEFPGAELAALVERMTDALIESLHEAQRAQERKLEQNSEVLMTLENSRRRTF